MKKDIPARLRVSRSPGGVDYRIHVVFATMTLLLLALVVTQVKRRSLTFDQIISRAELLAAQPYGPRKPVASKKLQTLNYDQYRDIRWQDLYTLWRKQGGLFQVKFFFTGHLHSLPVKIYEVDSNGVQPIPFSPNYFNYGKNTIPSVDLATGAYAGFRIHYPLNKPDYLDEVLVMLGGSYFRAVAQKQQYGMSARGLALNTGLDNQAEEFPSFTEFWLVKPEGQRRQLKLYALLDSPSVTGAYEINLYPGAETRMEIHSVLFFRKKVASLGIAPLTSMFWYGENTSNTFGGFRPEVHDSDGILIQGPNNEWLWRPLSWAKIKQLNLFKASNPAGFGLLQRDRDFTHYQDLEANYHQRPSVWVVPHGEWGEGDIKLVQLPTDNEYMDNVVALWQPKRAPQKGDRLSFAYTLYWSGENAGRPPVARCLATRIDYQDVPYYRLFVLDFAGDPINNLPQDKPPQPSIQISEGGEINDITVVKNTYDNTWRVSFMASSKLLRKPLELRCTLRDDQKPLSETWTYTWIPQL
jgi:periplasmic glucans biosynthesis protein